VRAYKVQTVNLTVSKQCKTTNLINRSWTKCTD